MALSDGGVSMFSANVTVFAFAVPVGFFFPHFLPFYDGEAVPAWG